MPFSDTKASKKSEILWDESFSDLFKFAIECCGYVCNRADPNQIE